MVIMIIVLCHVGSFQCHYIPVRLLFIGGVDFLQNLLSFAQNTAFDMSSFLFLHNLVSRVFAVQLALVATLLLNRQLWIVLCLFLQSTGF